MPYGFEDDKSKFDLDDYAALDTGWIATASGKGAYRRVGNVVKYRYWHEYSGGGVLVNGVIDTLPVEVLPKTLVDIVGNARSSSGTGSNYINNAMPFQMMDDGRLVYLGYTGNFYNYNHIAIDAIWFMG